MSQQQELPLLLLPTTGQSDREKRTPGWARIHIPGTPRQIERLTPKFEELQRAFDQRRVQLQAIAPTDDPELVVVFETIGAPDGFLGAVKKTAGLEWLLESDEKGLPSDDDFYGLEDDGTRSNDPLNGRLFLLGSNRQALSEILVLWGSYHNDPAAKLAHGLGKWKEIFSHLHDVRFWSAQDRIGSDVRQYWEDQIANGEQTIRFEIEAWCFMSPNKNDQAAQEIRGLVAAANGSVLSTSLITEIAYHGFLIEMPAAGVQSLLADTPLSLALSERIMFFRPRGQALIDNSEQGDAYPGSIDRQAVPANGNAIAALLDGFPMQNHPLLAGRLIIDDPDGWEASYEARDRVHGTAMASLIVHGELDAAGHPLATPLYVRPIMRPDPSDTRTPKSESTPDDQLLLDLFHRAVRRIFEGEGSAPASAPSVRVINLSVGDIFRPFDTDLSPWARLLDWLSYRYNVLFIVSAGNNGADLTLNIPRDSIATLPADNRKQLALAAALSDTTPRRVLAPAESMNALTVGALHSDRATFLQVPGRYDVIPEESIAPYSRLGHGYRRAVKPELLFSGGRLLYRERIGGPAAATHMSALNSPASPGHRVATPPGTGGENTRYSRGTSNATALATRWAVQAHSVIEALRADDPRQIPERYDPVLIKALLAHGAEWGHLEQLIHDARPDLTDWRKKKDFVTRVIGYGRADVDRALTCTEQRATLLGMGDISEGQGIEFRAPLPPCLIAQTVQRRLTVTLAWMSPTNPRHARYRAARLWIDPPNDALGVTRSNCDWQHVQRGTLQHEVLEGANALAFLDGDTLLFKVNCAEDAGKLLSPVRFALCVSLEVAPGINLPIYQEVRDRIRPRVSVNP